MTLAFGEVNDNRYIIKSGSGYFVRFNGNTPHMTTSPILASVFNYYEAVGYLIIFEKLGYHAELVREGER